MVHDARHPAATLLLDQGVSVQVAQEIHNCDHS
jgi:site-specific recombinase XerD